MTTASGPTSTNLLTKQWWHPGTNALGRTRTFCEEADAVVTRGKQRPPGSTYEAPEQVRSHYLPPNTPSLATKLRKSARFFVHHSTLGPSAGLGLFAKQDICRDYDPAGKHILLDQYKGSRHPNPASHYTFRYTCPNGRVIEVDAASPTSCYSRYANDSLYEPLDNLRIIEVDGKLWITPRIGATILAGDELFLPYDNFWYGPPLEATQTGSASAWFNQWPPATQEAIRNRYMYPQGTRHLRDTAADPYRVSEQSTTQTPPCDPSTPDDTELPPAEPAEPTPHPQVEPTQPQHIEPNYSLDPPETTPRPQPQ